MSVQVFKRFLPTLKEIRIHMCPNAAGSNGVRQFIDKYYIDIKKNNPTLPILVRECNGAEAKIWFRFDYGNETHSSVNNMNGDQIAKLIADTAASKTEATE